MTCITPAALDQISACLDKARAGAREQRKMFKALGIDIGSKRYGYLSLDKLLPTITDRISSIKDEQLRIAVETRLFGVDGWKNAVRYMEYIKGFDRAVEAHARFTASVPRPPEA